MYITVSVNENTEQRTFNIAKVDDWAVKISYGGETFEIYATAFSCWFRTAFEQEPQNITKYWIKKELEIEVA